MILKFSVNSGNIILFFINLGLVYSITIMNSGNLATSITNFACNINQRVEPNGNENKFTSALSAFNVLTLILAGARGNTEKQMMTAMSIGIQDKTVIFNQIKDIISQINKANPNYTLKTANRVYIQTLELLSEYSEVIKTYFTGSLEKVDFSKSIETLKIINDWVNLQTDGKISSILTELPDDTRLILVNAIYFKAPWKYMFNKAFTNKEAFTTAAGQIVQTDLMKMENPKELFNYTNSNSLGCEILELPYSGQTISMYIFLPHIGTQLDTFEKTLNSQNINQAINSKIAQQITEIKIPKMHLEKSYDLSTVLQNLGMVDLFSNAANLGGISKELLKVDKILQKTYLDVNEEGTEAAAVTVGILVPLSASVPIQRPEIRFIANRSFVFVIRDNTNNVDYFMGSFAHP